MGMGGMGGMGMGGMGMPFGMPMDDDAPAELTEEDIADITDEFMARNIENVAKRKIQCNLCNKQLSTMGIMSMHFEREHQEEALAWFHEMEAGGGEEVDIAELNAAMGMFLGMAGPDMAQFGPGPFKPQPQSKGPASGSKRRAARKRRAKREAAAKARSQEAAPAASDTTAPIEVAAD
mmetsp:Transcript_24252/g.57453  ORF Transcript_24252/g.57453 Transcript_24252/m.57453 type:complete len:178 (+) Transcript_24252:2-535(+)